MAKHPFATVSCFFQAYICSVSPQYQLGSLDENRGQKASTAGYRPTIGRKKRNARKLVYKTSFRAYFSKLNAMADRPKPILEYLGIRVF